MYTYEDSILHALDYLGAGTGTQGEGLRDCKRAVLGAYRDLATEHKWSYLVTTGRIQLNPSYTDGVAEFDKTGGASENLWTFDPGPLPDWAGLGMIRVGNVIYQVDQRIDDTTLTTLAPYTPASDIESTSFALYQDTYLMPRDFTSTDQFLYENSFGGMQYRPTAEWLMANRYVDQVGDPRWYSISGDSRYPGRLVARVWPYPGLAKTVDFSYRRSFRPLKHHLISTGSATATNLSYQVAVEGNLSLPDDLVGSILRLSSDRTALPTSAIGDNPYAYEGVITRFEDNVLTLNDPVLFSGVSLKYTISDPVDVEEKAMLTAFVRGIEKQLSIQRVFPDKPSARLQYEEAIKKAKAADSRSYAGRACGKTEVFRQRMADMPMHWD